MLFFNVAFVVFAVFLLLFSLIKRKYPSLNKLPGPKPNFFLGNLVDFLGTTDQFLTTLVEYCKTYGGIVKAHDGPFNTCIVATDPKFMEYMLSSTKHIAKSPHYGFFKKWLGEGLLTSTGGKWKERRRMLNPSFHSSLLQNFVGVFDSVTDTFIKVLNEHAGNSSLDIYPLVSLCTLDVMCESTMGITVDAQINSTTEYVRSVKAICRIATNRSFSVLDPSLYPLTIDYFKEKKLVKIVHDHTYKIIDNKLKDYENKNNITDESIDTKKKKLAFLDLLLATKVNGEPLSREDIREEVDTIMFGGHDSTSSAISFALYALATNPYAQAKALEEQIQLFGDIKNPSVTMEDLQNMKYLESVLKEALRLYPPVPFIGRTVIEDFEYDGVLYPKGLCVMMFPFASHRNPEYFPNPEKFLPERFNDNVGKNPFVYCPFSAGPRNCIGQRFAMLLLKATVSKTLRYFELLPAQPKYQPKLASEIMLISNNGVRVSLKRRPELTY